MVRNVCFVVKHDLVSNVLQLPRFLESPYPYTSQIGPSQLAILTLFCGETATHHGVSKVNSDLFTSKFKCLNSIICLNLFRVVQPLLESTYYDLINNLGLSIPLWVSRGGVPIRNSQITTIPPKSFAIKLKSIVRD